MTERAAEPPEIVPEIAPETAPKIALVSAESPPLIDAARVLIREYADLLDVDLRFQDVETEIATLPGEYAAPDGALLVALVDGQVAGCVALRRLTDCDYPDACEMKRLYVRRAFRRFGLGRMLAQQVMDVAAQAGYATLLLDTLDEMETARGLYATLGFEEIPPYYYNPIAGAHYLKVQLDASRNLYSR